ncbi:hypothetical protein ACA910_005226 [Epithemia clementina (nom. ined.)]
MVRSVAVATKSGFPPAEDHEFEQQQTMMLEKQEISNVHDEQASRHSALVLFYKYFLPTQYPVLHKYGSYFETRLAQYQRVLCERLRLKGRILISREGINGTLSAESDAILQEYIDGVNLFELLSTFPDDDDDVPPAGDEDTSGEYLFRDIDWKRSTNEFSAQPFPDLKISIVKEIISTNDAISVGEISELGGTHLSPSEFHQAILENDNVVLIDVRNAFEYDIGHFIDPKTQNEAINPDTFTFSTFDDTFCARRANELRDKKVLMYCTGGIRCEKASVMLKKKGVKDVSQLKGGIHRYLEEYGEHGLFRGLNFVFDHRVAMKPAECKIGSAPSSNGGALPRDIVGKCLECAAPFDVLSGSRICTVCRVLVLVCPSCCNVLREYHCRRHQSWKKCYFTFLEVFDQGELETQYKQLTALRDSSCNKNVRRTLLRQLEKVQSHITKLNDGAITVNQSAPRRCRSCMEPNNVCNGLCWGFWKSM